MVVKDQGITEFSQVNKIKFSKINSRSTVRHKGRKGLTLNGFKEMHVGTILKGSSTPESGVLMYNARHVINMPVVSILYYPNFFPKSTITL